MWIEAFIMLSLSDLMFEGVSDERISLKSYGARMKFLRSKFWMKKAEITRAKTC